MEGDIPLCFGVLTQRSSPLDDEYTKALEDIHQFVFFGESTDNLCTSVEPAALCLSCESAARRVGAALDVRRRAGAPGLSVPALVVEVLARLTRMLFWEVVVPPQLSEREKKKILNADMKELERSLLPRFFLKLPVSPMTLQSLLMKAPLSAFEQCYAREEGFTSARKCTLPPLLADALLTLKINFGLDFLANINVETAMLQGRNSVKDGIPATPPHETIEKTNSEASTHCDKGGNATFGTSGVLHKWGAGENSASAAKPHSSSIATADKKPQEHHQERARQHLPTYMLTRRRSSAVLSRGEVHLIEQQECAVSDSPPNEAAADLASEEEEADAEVLAPATPVKKRIRRDVAAVPPSPFRPPREEQ